MLERPKECSGCPLNKIGEGFSTPEGSGSIPLLICGESLGYNEMVDGLPFRPQAPAGSILNRLIKEKGKFDRNQFIFWNICACHPPNDRLSGTSYEYQAANHCRIHFDRVIDRYKPRVILACGGLPFRHLVGLEGKNLNISKIRGYVFESSRYPGVAVVSTYHPSFIKRGNSHLMGVFLHDFLKAVAIAQRKLTEGKDFLYDPLNNSLLRYITEPKEEDALFFLKQVKENKNLLISFDIETEKSFLEEEDELEEYGDIINQIQFSISKYSGISFPFVEPLISIAKEIMAIENPKVGANCWDFDVPFLQKAGFKIGGRIDDTQWLQHHFSADIPIGLQYTASFYGFPFAWKHYASENLAWYGAADVDAPLWIMDQLPQKLKSRNLWDGYNDLVYKFKPILITTQERGLNVNKEKQDLLEKEIDVRKEEIKKELRNIVPDSFTKYKPSEGYVREPKEVFEARFNYHSKYLDGLTNISEESYVFNKTGFVKHNFNSNEEFIIPEALKGIITIPKYKEQGKVERWAKPLYFNPNSPDQVSDYIKFKGHENLANKFAININKQQSALSENESKKKENVSTSKAVLNMLAEKTGCLEYKLFVEFKELTKMKGTYLWKSSEQKCENNYCDGGIIQGGDSQGLYQATCQVCKGKGISKFGKVHTQFTLRPATMQTSSRAPNIQNGVERGRFAERFKETIEVPNGYLIVKCDYRSYHAKMLGFLAEDLNYIRLSSIDPHSYVTAHMLNLPNSKDCINWDDEKLIEYLKIVKRDYKAIRDDQAKHAILGIGFGLGEKGCFERYGEDFKPKQDFVLENWGRKRNNPFAVNPKTNITYIQEEIEIQGKKRVNDLYKLLRNLFPKVFDWQTKTIQLADKQGYIQTAYGARRWFLAASDIKYNKFGNIEKIVKGEQAEEALAFPVANSAFCHLREGMIMMAYEGNVREVEDWNGLLELQKGSLLEQAGLVNMVHDDLRFEIKEDRLYLLKEIKKILERKSSKLKNNSMKNGFFCEVDIKLGKNLNSLEEYKI